MTLVAVIVPVLNRPDRVAPLLQSLESEPRARPIFMVSPNDPAEADEIAYNSAAEMEIVEYDPGPGDYARKINDGYKLANHSGTYDWLFAGADDLRFHDGWLDAALRAHEISGQRFVGTNDMWNPSVRNGRHSTHTLIRMDYIRDQGCSWDGPGIVYHEGYDHQCVDNEAVFLAKQRGEFVHAADSFVEHLHPFAKKAQMDATYEKALAHGRDDIRLFRDRQRAHTPRRSTQR